MLYDIVKPILDKLDPSTAHRLMMRNIEWFTTFGCHEKVCALPDENPVYVMGLRFPNAVGLAAGLDRNGEEVSSFGALGFGFVEAGSITPSAYEASPSAVCKRDLKNSSILHSMNLGSIGGEAALLRLKSADAFYLRGGITGISIAPDPQSSQQSALHDLKGLLRMLHIRADYFALNLFYPASSDPLVWFKNPAALKELLEALSTEQKRLAEDSGRPQRPIALKISADLSRDELLACADLCMESGIDGVIACGPLLAPADKANGSKQLFISGGPARERSTQTVGLLAEHTAKALPIIACGGIFSAADALEKIQAGASLIELFSGFVFKGPALIAECSNAIAKACSSNAMR